jgi:hypothetical protein
MNNPQHILRIYGLLLSLYPPRFRSEFEAEMQAVFADLLAQERRGGGLAVLILLLRELFHAPHALWSAYRIRRYRPRLSAGKFERWLSVLFDPALPLPVLDGRRSRRQAALELSLFFIQGGALILSTYLLPILPAGIWRTAAASVNLAAVLLPAPIFLIGLGRGMPRWAYPSAGELLGTLFLIGSRYHLLPFLALMLLAAFSIILAAALGQKRYGNLPLAYRRLGRSLSLDRRRLSFGFYGLLPLAISFAFDDGFIDGRTPYLGAAVLFMLAGALVFIRSSRTEIQLAALLLGLTGAMGMAVLDRAFFESRLGLTGWVFWSWASLSVLLLFPILLGLSRFLQRAIRL